eukprot:UN06768
MASSEVFAENQSNVNVNDREQYTEQYKKYNNNKWQTPQTTKTYRNNDNNNRTSNKNNNYPPGRNNNNFQANNNVNCQPNNNETRDREPEREPERDTNVKRERPLSTEQYATACDVKKVLSMVEQLRGQMRALQFQIDNLKNENAKLIQQVVTLEKQKKMCRKPSNNRSNNSKLIIRSNSNSKIIITHITI